VINTLIGAASDPEAIVRAQAVRALAAAGDDKAIPPLSARLVDLVRAVRIAAAESLLFLGVTQLPGRAGAALAEAQDEYAASLATFGDMPGDHVALAWLQTQRGRNADAQRAIQAALSLSPDDLQPRVIRGVIAAREGRYADALRDWQFVRDKAPAWPNIDRLIAEARKRKP
jgi:HEAT repeat protein